MIASISGTIKHVTPTSAVIEVGGVGMLVHLPTSLAASLVVGRQTELSTTLVVREDALTLYGFETPTARDFFELLQTVSGIGPKVAQSALSMFDEVELANAVSSGDNQTLEKIPGLGKKGVQRLVLELKDKVQPVQLDSANRKSVAWRISITGALLNLGYAQRQVDEVLDAIARDLGSSIDAEPIAQLLKLALQYLGRANG